MMKLMKTLAVFVSMSTILMKNGFNVVAAGGFMKIAPSVRYQTLWKHVLTVYCNIYTSRIAIYYIT